MHCYIKYIKETQNEIIAFLRTSQSSVRTEDRYSVVYFISWSATCMLSMSRNCRVSPGRVPVKHAI
jgi:hypothetical protein